tara:strand:+ start:67 stop:777 length:711 start_codon:yes stop_codon:yes gene_type:complete
MRKFTISLITLSWIALFGFSTASAGGIGVGFTAQYLNVEADGKEVGSVTGNETDSSTNTAAVEHSTGLGSFYVEYALDNNFALGYESIPGAADVSGKTHIRVDTETSVSGDVTENSTSRQFKAGAEVENYSVIYAEIPVYRGFYARVGYNEIDVNTLEVASGNGGSYGNVTLNGMNYGVGFKMGTSGGIVTKLSYEVNDFDDLSITSSGNSADSGTNTLTADLDTSAVKLAIGYQF